jgi:hypothetical protein
MMSLDYCDDFLNLPYETPARLQLAPIIENTTESSSITGQWNLCLSNGGCINDRLAVTISPLDFSCQLGPFLEIDDNAPSEIPKPKTWHSPRLPRPMGRTEAQDYLADVLNLADDQKPGQKRIRVSIDTMSVHTSANRALVR